MKKITPLLLSLITLLSLQCSDSNPPAEQSPAETSTPVTKKMTFFNAGLKSGITVAMEITDGKISGTLTREPDYEKQELFPFSSDMPYQEGAKMCMTFKSQETGYPLPEAKAKDAACWKFGKNEAGEFGLYIPTNGKNHDSGEYMDYDMFLEQVEE